MYGVHNYINNVSIRTMSIFISVDKNTCLFFNLSAINSKVQTSKVSYGDFAFCSID